MSNIVQLIYIYIISIISYFLGISKYWINFHSDAYLKE